MRTPITLPTGLIETTPTGRVPLGFYDDGVNVRDWDERGQRARLASRAGLLKVGEGSPCPVGSAVLHSFTSKRPLSRYEFTELMTTAQGDVDPEQVAETFSTDYDSEPLASAVGPDGLWHTLHADGQVTTTDPKGIVSPAFTLEIPVSFTLVPSLVVDELGGVICATTYTRQIDGFAAQVTRYRRDGDSDWVKTYDEPVEEIIERFWGADLELYMALRRPDNIETGAEYTLARFGGTQAAVFSRGFTRPIAAPVVDVRRRGAALFVAAAPNRSRSQSNSGSSATVDWTPFELASADKRLFSWLSALRAQREQGFIEGASVTTWDDAKLDANSLEIEVLDDTLRGVSDRDGYPAPKFGIDPTYGPEIRFNDPGEEFGQILRSGAITSNVEKGTSSEVASWQRAVMPGMADAASEGTRFGLTGLVRIENYEVTTGSNLIAFTDWKIIWQQGLFSLEYRGETSIEVRLRVAGSSKPTETTTFASVSEMDLCFTFVFNGKGVPGSFLRLNGVQVDLFASGTLNAVNITEVAQVDSRMNLGGTTYAPRLTKRHKGAWRELISYLGRDVAGVHDGAPLQDEYERMEGYACHAYGLQSILVGSGHPYAATAPDGAGSTVVNPNFEAAFQLPDGLTIKLDAADGAIRWVYGGDDAGNGLALDSEDGVYTIGTPLDLTTANPDRLSKLLDLGDDKSVEWSVKAGTLGSDTVFRGSLVRMYVDPCDQIYVPFVSIGTTPVSELRKYDPDGALTFAFPIEDAPTFVGPGGLFVDDRFRGGPCADEYLYVTCRSTKKVKRVEILGRRDTGETRDQETEELAVCASGVVSRLVDGVWVTQASDFTPGARPWSFEFFGKTFVGGPEDYRVYDAKAKTLREWTPRSGSVIPERIFQAARWRGRVLCVSQDDPHIIYGSAYGDAFDFKTGGDQILATQAFAGTTAAAGAIPDPITALVVASDDLVYIGTNRSVWRLTGDPQTGGQLDDVLATEGILGPFAHCRGSSGELYWVTTALRVLQMSGAGLRDISSDTIRGRIQAIDRDKYRVELEYSDREQGLYLAILPRSVLGGEQPRIMFWSARSQRWHPCEYAGGIDRHVTSMSAMESADAGGWGIAFGFADGGLRYVHPEALDDDGIAIPWRVRIPLGGDGDRQRSLVTHAEIVLDPLQGPVRCVGVTGRTGAQGDDYGQETLVVPGRGDFVPVQVAGPHTWLELTGAGESVAVDDIAVNIVPWGVN